MSQASFQALYESSICHSHCIRTETEWKFLGVNDEHPYINSKILCQFIIRDHCIDCIKHVIGYTDLSYESLKATNFEPWFTAIRYNRQDVIEALIEYGCERYGEYITDLKYDSYSVLIDSFYNHRIGFFKTEGKKKFIEFFELFIAAGIPVDESICQTICRVSYPRSDFYKIMLQLLQQNGYSEEEWYIKLENNSVIDHGDVVFDISRPPTRMTIGMIREMKSARILLN